MTPETKHEASNAHRESDEVMTKRRERKHDICVCVGQTMTVSICCPGSAAKSHDLQ